MTALAFHCSCRSSDSIKAVAITRPSPAWHTDARFRNRTLSTHYRLISETNSPPRRRAWHVIAGPQLPRSLCLPLTLQTATHTQSLRAHPNFIPTTRPQAVVDTTTLSSATEHAPVTALPRPAADLRQTTLPRTAAHKLANRGFLSNSATRLRSRPIRRLHVGD